MVREYALLGVDIGATNIKCAMGVKSEDTQQIDIISAYTVPTIGIRDGFMEDRDALVDVINQGIMRVQDSALCTPNEALFSISSRYFFTRDIQGNVSISDGHVTQKDILRCVEDCHANAHRAQEAESGGYAISHSVPQQFILDRQNPSLSPLGRPALNLDLRAHLFYGHKEITNAFWSLGEASLKLPLKDVVCDLLVQAEGLLSQRDLETSVMILDMGSETTKVMIFNEGRPIYFHSRYQGGFHLTQEIQQQLNLDHFDDAENLKFMHGVIRDDVSRETPRIPIYTTGPTRYIRQETLTRILERVLTENLSAIRVRLEEDRVDHYLRGGVILSGGSANILGVERLASEVLQTTSRIGKPIQTGVKDLVQAPQYASVNGLILGGLKRRYDTWFGAWKRPIRTIPAVHQARLRADSRSWWRLGRARARV
jgi:cell division protein FtsA